ncbi:MAG: GNAT family N-acetyltransferase [Ornithinibacter sp.]
MSEPGAVVGERHPVADLLLSAWRGPRPDVDGSWARVRPWREGVYAVVAVTGRAMVAAPARVSDADLDSWGVDGFGGAHDPRVMTRLAGERGWVDVLDAVLLAEGTGSGSGQGSDRPLDLRPRADLRNHPRVRHALPIRGNVRVFGPDGDDETVLTLATGIGGLAELSFQVAPSRRGTGLGTALARAARTLVPAGIPLAACVSPANVPSLRALLAAGFDPVGSVQVYRPEP